MTLKACFLASFRYPSCVHFLILVLNIIFSCYTSILASIKKKKVVSGF